jgi:hypothetical protein
MRLTARPTLAVYILGRLGLRSARIRSLRSATLPSPANPQNPRTRVRFIGSGNVVGRRPLGASSSPRNCLIVARASGRQAHLLKYSNLKTYHSCKIIGDDMSDNHPEGNNPSKIQNKKEEVVEQLKSAYVDGYLILDDYEFRIAKAVNSNEMIQLEEIVSDLPKIEITVSESISFNMVTKKLEGTILLTKKLNINASMSTITIDYQLLISSLGKQEIFINLDMSTLILYLPDDVIVENWVEEKKLTYKDKRNSNRSTGMKQKLIKLTGLAKMSSIIIESQ